MKIEDLAWQKMDGLMPAIVQDAFDGRVLMQGYMNRDALKITFESGQVTFWSRSRQTLWTKGETSGQRPTPSCADGGGLRSRHPARESRGPT